MFGRAFKSDKQAWHAGGEDPMPYEGQPIDGSPAIETDRTEIPSNPADAASEVIARTFDLVEADIESASRTISAATGSVRDKVADKIRMIEEIKSDTLSLAGQSEEAKGSANELADALSDLATSTDRIGAQVEETSEMAASAETVADEASRGIEDLKEAISQIENVVNLIADVAKQTNLLALNATIEAARAGEAGRGFAVVAGEVKALSGETQRATDEITDKIGGLQESAQRSIAAVNAIIERIGQLRPVFASVSDAVREQVEATSQIGDSARRTAGFVNDVTSHIETMCRTTEEAVAVGGLAEAESRSMADLAGSMNTRLRMMLRQTEIGDRRRSDRLPVQLGGTIQSGSDPIPVRTVDLSDGGFLCKTENDIRPPIGAKIEATLDRIGPVSAHVVADSSLGLHCAFDVLSDASAAALAEILDAVRSENEAAIAMATDAADRIGRLFEEALADGRIAAEALFDTDYSPLPDTDPVQFSVAGLDFLESVLPDIQEPLLQADPKMAFCAAVDRNGYLPVHNAVFSKPQRPDDPVWNAGNSRNRRIFDDRAGLCAARNLRPFLVQSYPRDMGDGTIVWMKEVDAPIVVDGRHWGGFRTAYKL
ncbi:MAG: methyl-accepting chemotaxis protein [Pseudomonadota bacterium]